MRYLFALGLGTMALVGCGGNVSTSGGGGHAGAGGHGTGGTTTGTSSSSSNSSSSSSGTSTCTAANCNSGLACCGNVCVNHQNDILNCGTCGNKCPGAHPFCNNGTCGTPPCSGGICSGTDFCCGGQCCTAGQICCEVNQGPSLIKCQAPDPMTGTCDKGCPACVCASPDTPIATPQGDRPIADLAVGDFVYSVDRDAVVAVPVLRVNRTPVRDHHVVRVTLASGAVLEISARHPMADGRTFGDLHTGDTLDRLAVTSVEVIPYAHPFTYDILPASGTHTYFAGGALIGTTIMP